MPETLSANQLVAYNLMRIRKALGLSQEEAAERLERYLGARWSKAVYSAAERSYDGKRIRQFTADELLAMAAAFGVPIAYFFLPPRPQDRPADSVMLSGRTELAWQQLIIATSGFQYAPAILMRLRELPKDEQPEWPPSEPFVERYGLAPGSGESGEQG